MTSLLYPRAAITRTDSFPPLFGRACTRTLAYVALNPLRTAREIRISLGSGAHAVREQFDQRLCPMGVVVGHRTLESAENRIASRAYELDPSLSGYEPLRDFLRQLGIAAGMRSLPPGRHAVLSEPSTVGSRPIPLALFWDASRARILALAGALGEIYAFELVHALGMSVASAQDTLGKMVSHGFMYKRKPGRLRLYGLNPELPGADSFKRLLRQMAAERHEIGAAARMMLARRKRVTSYRACDKRNLAAIESDSMFLSDL